MENEKSVMELLEELKEHLSDVYPDEKFREKIVNALIFQMIEG